MIDLIVKLNTVEITNKIQAQSLQITDSLNQRRDTCSFVVRKTPSNTLIPELNDEVEVFDDTLKIFGGVIVSVDQSVEVADMVEYKVTCTDYTQYLDRRLVLERFEDETIGDIIDYLLTTYAPEFTSTNVIGDTVVESIAFNRIPISDCIEKLAKSIGYSWYVDYEKDIHFFPSNTESAPFDLTDTSENFIWNSLDIKRDLSQLRNVVFVEGGEQVGEERTEVFEALGSGEERRLFRLANKFAELPVVEVEGIAQTVGVDYLNDDGSFDCMWNFNEKYIRFTDGNIPALNDEVTVTGNPLFPVIIRVQSVVSIGQHGVYEYVIRDKSIRSRDEARERALAELTSYQNGVVEGRFRTYTAGLKAGQTILINSTIRDINERFLIQSVSFRMRTPEDGEWTISLATLRTVGIIEFLRGLMQDKEIKENEAETLLTFLQFSDEATASDTLTTPFTKTSPPYMIMPTDPGDDASVIASNPTKTPARLNYCTIAS